MDAKSSRPMRLLSLHLMQFNRKEFIKLAGAGGLSAALGSKIPAVSAAQKSVTPKALSQGDTIGMISPASSLPEDLSYGKVAKKIEDLGFKVKVGEHAKSQFGYLPERIKSVLKISIACLRIRP